MKESGSELTYEFMKIINTPTRTTKGESIAPYGRDKCSTPASVLAEESCRTLTPCINRIPTLMHPLDATRRTFSKYPASFGRGNQTLEQKNQSGLGRNSRSVGFYEPCQPAQAVPRVLPPGRRWHFHQWIMDSRLHCIILHSNPTLTVTDSLSRQPGDTPALASSTCPLLLSFFAPGRPTAVSRAQR